MALLKPPTPTESSTASSAFSSCFAPQPPPLALPPKPSTSDRKMTSALSPSLVQESWSLPALKPQPKRTGFLLQHICHGARQDRRRQATPILAIETCEANPPWSSSFDSLLSDLFSKPEPLAKHSAHVGEIAFFAALIERCIILGRERSRILALRAHFRHAATRAR